MASTFFGLNIAYTGLQAANASLNTTGNNISNVETKGYSRQETVQTAADALRMNTTYGMAGSGVNTTAITQIRNKYYDLKYWQNNASLGSYNIKQYYMKQIENYYTETDTVKGFGTIFSAMFDGLNEVYKSPGDDTVKSQFLSQAGDLCEYFGAMSTNMTKLQEDANAEIKNKADEINSIASQIATLNKQINVIEITGVTANELRDKRNLLVDQLSSIVDVEISETPVYIAEGSTEKSGIYKYDVTIAGGQSLVEGYDYNTLSCVARENKVNQSDADGLYDLVWSNSLEFNLYGKNLGGELKGLVELRDGNNEEYFHGKTAAVGDKTVNGTAVKTVTIATTADYLQDINKCTLPETGTITLGNKTFDFTGWEFDAASGEYTFTLKAGEDPTAYVGKDASVGTSIDYQGIPYYMEQMNEWVRQFAETMNAIERKAQDADGNQAEVLFTGDNVVDNDRPYKFDDYYANPDKTSSDGDTYYKLTAATFQVNASMVADTDKFGTTADIAQGQDAQDITEELLTVKTSKDKMTFRGCTSEEFLQTILSDIALNASSANTFYKNYTNISTTITNQRLSVSGVDNDEEALSLVKFQESYNLASKMIQIMSEVYDRLILSTGV